MTAAVETATGTLPDRNKRLLWAGRVVTALPSLLFLFSAVMKLSNSPQVQEQFATKLGYPAGTLLGIGILELVCLILYLVPQTAVLGAVLLTGYLGGATASHLRVGDPFISPVVIGVLVWAGLYLRDDRLRALLPLRKTELSAAAAKR